MSKSKHKQINNRFNIPLMIPNLYRRADGTTGVRKTKKTGIFTVQPFNGEDIGHVSWSHGFTHMKIIDTPPEAENIKWWYDQRKQNITFCGQIYFNENAVLVT